MFYFFLVSHAWFLHATKCISLGLVSFTIAKSFFLITVFFLVFVSSFIVVGELLVILPSGIIFHSGFSVPSGSGAFRASVFRATCFFCVS